MQIQIISSNNYISQGLHFIRHKIRLPADERLKLLDIDLYPTEKLSTSGLTYKVILLVPFSLRDEEVVARHLNVAGIVNINLKVHKILDQINDITGRINAPGYGRDPLTKMQWEIGACLYSGLNYQLCSRIQGITKKSISRNKREAMVKLGLKVDYHFLMLAGLKQRIELKRLSNFLLYQRLSITSEK
ncbi:hypothetical protein [Scandinavium sp.]|uniref:hypothetical protein n=1 Tax=Scandinavium sp. TaxID=2830653 RepID=UPI00289E61AA|nr:hypothetical protein [Scandinavium sp.]